MQRIDGDNVYFKKFAKLKDLRKNIVIFFVLDR